jgi:bla regulator protein BlaR1
MASDSLAMIRTAIASALGNHLWQSTLFAALAGLLTLALRKNEARVRYWLWLAASLKFLIPFWLLAGIGSHLGWLRGSAATKASLYSTIEEVSFPFTQPDLSIPLGNHSAASLHSLHLLPVTLVALWFAGFVVVLSLWCTRWRRISAATREAAPLREGREVEMLRRLERQGVGTPIKPIEIRQGRAPLEPGVFGIVRPVLLWPAGISKHLEDDHLEAILAHELWHVRRRDNLAAAMHMLVEAIFWFHPLVWWLEARLVEERERACDEEVLHLGKQPQVYAEGILKVCEFCLGYSLICVSEVTGADLKKRIVRIMTARVARKLDFTRKLLLAAAGLVALASPVAFGLLYTTESGAEPQSSDPAVRTPEFEVTSIKPSQSGKDTERRISFMPDGFSATGITLQMLIRVAYEVQDFQISGAPTWLNTEQYDVSAKTDKSVADELQKLSSDQHNRESLRMLQALLADRFRLTLHRETKEQLPVYALVIAKNGPKLHEVKPSDADAETTIKLPNGIVVPFRPGQQAILVNQILGKELPITNLVEMLSSQLGRTVVDKTGLTGKYDWNLQWTPEPASSPMFKGAEDGQTGTDNAVRSESAGPSIFAAIQEQLGLKLELKKGILEVLVIEHVEKPSEN